MRWPNGENRKQDISLHHIMISIKWCLTLTNYSAFPFYMLISTTCLFYIQKISFNLFRESLGLTLEEIVGYWLSGLRSRSVVQSRITVWDQEVCGSVQDNNFLIWNQEVCGSVQDNSLLVWDQEVCGSVQDNSLRSRGLWFSLG